jgi:hypothetical protein
MPILTASTIRPNQALGTGDELALAIEEYAGAVEHTIKRVSKLDGFIPVRSVKGTPTIQNYAISEATLGKVTPGQAPDGAAVPEFNKATLTIDELVYARNIVPLLDSFQTQYDARQEIGIEHGRKIGKFKDQVFFIQAMKAATAVASKYGALDGHSGGSQYTLASANDVNDPAAVYSAIAKLFALMRAKDVIPEADDLMLALPASTFYTLLQAEQIVNGTYVTANGTRMENAMIFKAFGVPVITSNNAPFGETISGNLLSNVRNSNAYDGNFTKVAGLAFSPRALLAGETIPLTSDVFYDKLLKSWVIDSHLSFGVTQNRNEYAGAILLP